MRTQTLVVMTVVALVACGGARADSELGVYGAYWGPSDGDESFGGGGKLAFDMVDRVQFELRTSVFSDLVDDIDGEVADLDDVAIEGGLVFTVPAHRTVEWYAGGGLGYHLLDGSGAAASASEEVGFYALGGLEWIVHRSGADYGETSAKFFVEVLYRFVDADGTTAAGPVDIDLDGPGVQIGLLVGW